MLFTTSDLIALFQGLGLVVLAPGITGTLNWIKARLQRRQGVGPLQPYRDLAKYLGKPGVQPEHASAVYAVAPYGALAAYGVLAFLTPVLQGPTLPPDEAFTALYLLGLARFLLSLAALDSGTPFAGLGAARTMFLQFVTEPGLVAVLFALTVQWGTTDLSTLMVRNSAPLQNGVSFLPAFFLLMIAFFLLLASESGRLPIDNPEGTLELTTIQPNLLNEYAGRDRGVIEWAEMIKFAALLTLFCGFFVPWGGVPGGAAPPDAVLLVGITFGLKIGLVLLLLAGWELAQPKLRLRQLARINVFALALSLIAIIFTIYSAGR